MSSMKELVEMFVGGIGQLEVGKLGVNVTITDVRQAYGRIDFLVTPLAGVGKEWVSQSRVTLGPIPALTQEA